MSTTYDYSGRDPVKLQLLILNRIRLRFPYALLESQEDALHRTKSNTLIPYNC